MRRPTVGVLTARVQAVRVLLRLAFRMDLRLRHLRSFLAVAEERHFGRAAARLGIAQPAVSRHVRTLEDELGAALLVRTSRHTELTEAGLAALAPARDMLAAADRLAAAAGARGGVTAGFIAPTLHAYAGALGPDVHIAQLRHADLADAVRRGTVDFAIARWLPDAPDLVQTHLTDDAVLAAVSSTHPLAARDALDPADQHGEPLILVERRAWPAGYDASLATLRELGIELSALRHTTSQAAAFALVAAGAGIYRIAASAATPRPGVTYVPIAGWSLPVVLLRRAEPPRPAVAEVIARLAAA
jgi:DNA-binding transcriptional LysR family regulator